jgi:predicted ArsR family transcriptional regulator
MMNAAGLPREKRSAEAAEAAVSELFASIYSRTVDEMIRELGDRGLELARESFLAAMVDGWKAQYEQLPDRSLETYIRWLTSIVTEGTRYEIVENTAASVRFRFTRCPWATCFRAIGRPEIGRFFCDADEPMIEEFSPEIGFRRTKTLMDGDACCDHHFYRK